MKSRIEILESQLAVVTEQLKVAQHQCVESRNLFEAIGLNFPNGNIVVLDDKLKIVFIEGKELRQRPYETKKLIGEYYPSLIISDAKNEIADKLKKVLQGEEATFNVEHKYKSYNANATPLFNKQKSITQLLIIETNITKQKKAEQDIYNALQKERELNELKSKFVSMASHEFRTPLAGILSSAILIEKYSKTTEQDRRIRHVNKIKVNIKNLTMILNDFLSLEKIEGGHIKYNPEHINLSALIEGIIDETMGLKKENQQVFLQNDLTSHQYTLDEFLMRNIMNNLISNAYKYSGDEGKVDIRIYQKNNSVLIDIKDNGIGISEEDQKELFVRFYRASNAGAVQGTGLGLNIVKRYVNLMDATLSFTSKLGFGSTFTLNIPTDEK